MVKTETLKGKTSLEKEKDASRWMEMKLRRCKLLIRIVPVAHWGLTHVGMFFKAEGLGGVVCGLEEGFIVGRTEYLRQTGLILGNPLGRRQGSGSFVEAFARDVFLADDYDHAGEQTLENV